MKAPVVAIAAAFAGGVLLGMSSSFSFYRTSSQFLVALVALLAVLLVAALVLALRDRVWTAAPVLLAAWVGLGSLAGCVAKQPLPKEHVLSRLGTGEIPARTPLRWYGVLRNEPSRMPWGYSLELELKNVDMATGYLPVTGGMRLGFTPRDDQPGLPELHAGDEVSALTEARLPLAYRDDGAFDRREFLARENIHVLATLRASVLLEKTGTARRTLGTRIARLRGRLRERVDGMFAGSAQTAGVLRAMLLGDRSFIERSESVDYQKTGVFHVLVVAGLHVGALAVFLFWVAKKLRFSQAAKTLFVLVMLFSYVGVVEQRAPVLRAALMAAVVIVGAYFHRRLDLLNSAALAALALLVAKPDYVKDTGFLLSFLAIGSIAGLALPMIQRWVQPFIFALENWRDVTRDASHPSTMVQFRLDVRDAIATVTARLRGRYATWGQDGIARCGRLGFRLGELLVLSCVLQLGMLPLMARDFHRISLLGPLANVFVVPLTGVIVPLGFFSLGVATVAPKIAAVLAHPLVWLVFLQQRIVAYLAAIPHSSYRIPGPPVWVMISFFVVAVLAVLRLRTEQRTCRWDLRALGSALMLLAVMIAAYPFRPAFAANELEVSVLDVGQGDSILVVSPKGSTLLIDGGGAFQGFPGREEHFGSDPGEEAVSAYLWSRGVKRLDAVALTHAHQDHVGGLTAVLQNFEVRRLLLGRETDAPAFGRLKVLASSLRIPVEHERRTSSFLWDGVQVDILWPEIGPEEVAPLAKNNDSLVVRLKYGERTILLPGDAEKQVEYAMLGENEASFLHADVLKVGHHGSKNSTIPEFLEAVSPRVSVISSGVENPYGHPSPELLERLEQSGTRILRTDENGAVRIMTDGHGLQVSCFTGCTEGKSMTQPAVSASGSKP